MVQKWELVNEEKKRERSGWEEKDQFGKRNKVGVHHERVLCGVHYEISVFISLRGVDVQVNLQKYLKANDGSAK